MPAPAAPQVMAPIKAFWVGEFPAQPVRKNPNAVNAKYFLLFISSSQED
jgi:hypothetical protein